MRRIVLPVLCLFVLTGCSAAAPADDARECLSVPAAALESIAEGANANPIVPIAAAAVESTERSDLTLIAMSFTDERTPDAVLTGVWGLGGGLDKDPLTGPWVAVDSFAQSWTDYPGTVGGEALSVTEDGASEAQDCLAALSD